MKYIFEHMVLLDFDWWHLIFVALFGGAAYYYSRVLNKLKKRKEILESELTEVNADIALQMDERLIVINELNEEAQSDNI